MGNDIRPEVLSWNHHILVWSSEEFCINQTDFIGHYKHISIKVGKANWPVKANLLASAIIVLYLHT